MASGEGSMTQSDDKNLKQAKIRAKEVTRETHNKNCFIQYK